MRLFPKTAFGQAALEAGEAAAEDVATAETKQDAIRRGLGIGV